MGGDWVSAISPKDIPLVEMALYLFPSQFTVMENWPCRAHSLLLIGTVHFLHW